jgi:hypothetical protein
MGLAMSFRSGADMHLDPHGHYSTNVLLFIPLLFLSVTMTRVKVNFPVIHANLLKSPVYFAMMIQGKLN